MRLRDRQSTRLRGFDYSRPGIYFVTTCTYRREHLFGRIVDGAMQLSTEGEPRPYECGDNGHGRDDGLHDAIRYDVTLGRIMAYFKYESTCIINAACDTSQRQIWQRGYHDRIVRDQYELERIRRYIIDNPRHWPG